MKVEKELYQSKYINGKTCFEATYIDEKMCGISKLFSSKGHLDLIDTNKKGYRHGIEIIFKYPENQTLPL